MKHATLKIVGLAFVLIASGCLDAGGSASAGGKKAGAVKGTAVRAAPDIIPLDWFENALPGAADHNHRDAHQHENLSTSNFELLGYNPLITDYYGKTAGDYFCGDQKETDGRTLSVVHSWGTDVAFVIADVTDPKNPVKLGELAMPSTQVYDIALTPDQKFVVLSTSPFDNGPDDITKAPIDAAPWGTWHNSCDGSDTPLKGPESGLPYACGVVLVDISNPLNPVIVDFRSLPVIGSHSVRANLAKGQTIVTVSVDNAASTASYYVFFQIMPTPAGPKLFPLSEYAYVPENQARAQPSVGVHMDGLVAEHPLTHQRIGWLAFRGVGFVMVDLDDPSRPQFLSNFKPFPIGVHSVLPLPELWDGKHYTIIGEECGGPSRGNPSCLIIVVDTTNPRDPKFVGAWTLPALVSWREGLQFSMHYFDVVNRTLFVTTYHGGLWAVDLSTPEALTTMPSVGVYIPSILSPNGFPTPPRSAAGSALLNTVANAPLADHPVVMDVVAASSGVLTIWDGQSGLYTLKFDPTNPAPPPTVEVKGIPKLGE